jgi:choline dehydrogenase-like flavoprotein
MNADAIVVGSGPAGANAAAALIEAGRTVLMLDVGDVDAKYASMIPAASFRDIRETDASQHRYMLGENLEGIPRGGVRVGAQLTPPRLHVTASAPPIVPILSDGFQAAESLALGGLGEAWGAGVFTFDDDDLAAWPIERSALLPHYEAIARRIGITRTDADLDRFVGGVRSAMPPLEIDTNAEVLLERYERERGSLNRDGFYLGRPPLAICTERLGDRGPHAYRDMEFWADADRSVYRPRFTIEALRRHQGFTYQDRRLVLRFAEAEGQVSVTARNMDTGDHETFTGRALLLAAGALGSARIVLRSVGQPGDRVPLLCNPYTYAPSINIRMLGRTSRDRRHSLAQLSAVYRPGSRQDGGDVQTQVYSYRSLLMFRLLHEAPLATRDSLKIMRLLVSSMAILGINHDDRPTTAKYCTLDRDGDPEGALRIYYALSEAEEARIDRNERAVLRHFRRLGCWAIKRVRPGAGASIHYAGTFPMKAAPRGLTCDADGRLAVTRSVHLVDGSTFPYLPAKGLTFTIMANANRIGSMLGQRLG